MLDINLIRSNPEYVKEALKKREYDVDFTRNACLGRAPQGAADGKRER